MEGDGIEAGRRTIFSVMPSGVEQLTGMRDRTDRLLSRHLSTFGEGCLAVAVIDCDGI